MNVIQDVMVTKIINFLDELLHKGKIKLNGEYKNYDVFKTIKEGNRIRKYLYLETETGYVEEAQLLSSTNEVLVIKPFAIEKQDDGLVLAFEFTIEVKEE